MVGVSSPCLGLGCPQKSAEEVPDHIEDSRNICINGAVFHLSSLNSRDCFDAAGKSRE